MPLYSVYSQYSNVNVFKVKLQPKLSVELAPSRSLLLTSLITMDPNGALRRPPQMILDTLQQYNAHYKIGHLLCRSRYASVSSCYGDNFS